MSQSKSEEVQQNIGSGRSIPADSGMLYIIVTASLHMFHTPIKKPFEMNSRLHDRGLVGLNIAYKVSGLGWNVGIRVLNTCPLEKGFHLGAA